MEKSDFSPLPRQALYANKSNGINSFLFFYWQWALVLQWQELSSSLPTIGMNSPNSPNWEW